MRRSTRPSASRMIQAKNRGRAPQYRERFGDDPDRNGPGNFYRRAGPTLRPSRANAAVLTGRLRSRLALHRLKAGTLLHHLSAWLILDALHLGYRFQRGRR
jgi:hypothetical protein